MSKSPSSGQLAYNSANNCNINVLNNFGRFCISITRKILITPLPSLSILIKSSTSKLFSPKKISAPCCCNSITFLKIVPVLVVDILPYSFSNSSLPSLPTYCNTLIKSFKSTNGIFKSSQYLKIIATTPACVSFNPRILLNKIGPNSLMVALNRTPFSLLNVSSSTGKAVGLKVTFSLVHLSFILSLATPACAIPLKSPLISITKTGTLLSLKHSLNIWSVFVFPVPVAPAISPCLFMVLKGKKTSAPLITSPLCIPTPIFTCSPLNV